MRLHQQLTSILLRRPNMPFSSCSHKCSHPRPVIRVFRSYILTSEWEARQSMIEHERKAGRINPSGSEMNFRGLSSRGNHKSYHFSAENSLRTGTKQWPRPAAIPWQPKMANTVHLIGTVSAPVEFIHMSKGKIRAATMLLRKSPSPSQCLGIRLIFEDDLAENAAYHLKQNDWIYVSGWLDVESQCSTNEKKQFVTQHVTSQSVKGHICCIPFYGGGEQPQFCPTRFSTSSQVKDDAQLNKKDPASSSPVSEGTARVGT